MRIQIAAANWKMNLTLAQANDLIDDMMAREYVLNYHRQVIVAVPFPYLLPVKQKLSRANIFVAAQNCAAKTNGAFTGEVSAEMLKSMDVTYVIIGHSERREYYNESNSLLAEKVNRALESGINPIFCCGEPLNIREAATQNAYVELQLKESLFHLSAEKMKKFIIAYEPIWAIGTGRTATSEQAQQMHAHIRSVISQKYGNDIAASVSILYGGSVKANNAAEIFGNPDVDGGLVGGASLNAAEFAAIIESLKKA
jgi:triosephosphate isomerase (TIM)